MKGNLYSQKSILVKFQISESSNKKSSEIDLITLERV